MIDGDSTETPVVDHETGEARRLKAGDVAILFRALSDVRLYEEALREQGLDYYLVGGHAFYAQQEIFDVLNLLRAVASTADEISLAGILRSPFFALTDESLFWLTEHGNGSLNAGLLAAEPPHELSGEEQAKVVAARNALAHLRAIKNKTPVAQLLNTALDLTGYDAVLLTEFLGERKLANLQKLIEHARTADRNNNDLNEYISQLAEFIAQPPKEPLASTSAESADVIRLMTIHRAKGLEFPFVVVPDLDRPPRLDGPDAALDDELGPLLRIPKDDSQEEFTTGITLFAARERGEELAERKRLLYVACTRAADYLLLSSSIESLDAPKGDWTKLLASHFDLQSGDFLGDLPPNFARPRVHIAPPPTAKQSLSRPRGPDLLRMLEDAHNLAAEGAGLIPPLIADIPANRAARRQFSFSRLTGKLIHTSGDADTITPAAPGSAGGLDFATPSDFDPSVAILSAEPSGNAPIDPRALGSLTHDVLARLDFNTAPHDNQITEWCEHLAPQFVIKNAPEAAALASSMIARFVTSPRGQQLATANQLQREIEFLLPWPPGESTGQYFRGYIDCLYQDAAGTWRIVDYKTNDVSTADTAHITKRYELQLYVYALAAEQALGTPPKELVLELLRPGIEHVIPWTPKTRGKAIDMITAALVIRTRTRLNSLPSTLPFRPPPASMPDTARQREFALEVAKKLRGAGFESLWAGGCVRDQLLGITPKDYDVATNATPDQIRDLFGHRRTLAIGASFGVITVLGPRPAGQIEVATFRTDATYSDGRHPDAVHFTTAEHDAERRDFTINGLFYDPVADKVVDYVNGQRDLELRIIRAIGDPRLRITEDKLRMLRAVRFAAAFNFEIEPATLAAIQNMAAEITTVSAERIGAEIRRMLLDQNRARALTLLNESRLLPHVLPEVAALPQAAFNQTLHVAAALNNPTLPATLASLLHSSTLHLSRFALGRRLRYTNKEIDRTAWLLTNLPLLENAATLPWPRLQRLLTHEGAAELIALREAIAGPNDINLAFCRERLAWPPERLNPPPLLDGSDLIQHGLSPGPNFAALLEQTRDAQLNGEIHTREEALALVDQLIDRLLDPPKTLP